ncbi:MAG: RNA ligase family protein, partial [Myxococcales bacterium]|nr:RNA ligase family protein [Myxococcales bacterium]
KIDGANVAIWRERGRLEAMGRGGVGAMDRGRQIGRLRAWLGERHDRLISALAPGEVLYGEWLYRRHHIQYTHAPSLLVILDLWIEGTGFAPIDRRDARATACGLPVPPTLFEGTLGGLSKLRSLHAKARWADEPAEGLVVRAQGGERLLAKVIAPSAGLLRGTPPR